MRFKRDLAVVAAGKVMNMGMQYVNSAVSPKTVNDLRTYAKADGCTKGVTEKTQKPFWKRIEGKAHAMQQTWDGKQSDIKPLRSENLCLHLETMDNLGEDATAAQRIAAQNLLRVDRAAGTFTVQLRKNFVGYRGGITFSPDRTFNVFAGTVFFDYNPELKVVRLYLAWASHAHLAGFTYGVAPVATGRETRYPHHMPSILRVGPVDAIEMTAPVGGSADYADLCTTKTVSAAHKCDRDGGKDDRGINPAYQNWIKSVSPSDRQSVRQPVGQSDSQSASQSVSQSVIQSVSQSVSQSTSQPVS